MLDYLFKILNMNFIINYLKIYFNNEYKELFIIIYIELFIFLAMFLKLLIFFFYFVFFHHYIF